MVRKMMTAWLQLIVVFFALYIGGKAIVHLGRVVAEPKGVVGQITRSYFGAFVLQFQRDPFNIGEYTSATMLLLAGMVSLSAFHLLGDKKLASESASRWFWFVLAWGFVFLSLDDLFTFHEFVGLNLGVGNGKVLLVYALGAGIFLVAHRRRMLPDRGAVILLACGCIGHAVALGLDLAQEEGLFPGWTPEEILEVPSSILYATYIFYLAARELVVVHGLRLVWTSPGA